jgi:hypothetical protein
VKSAALALVAAMVFAGAAFGRGTRPAAEDAIRITPPPPAPAAPPAAAASPPAPAVAPARPVAPSARQTTPRDRAIQVREVDRPTGRQRLAEFDRGERRGHHREHDRGNGHQRGRGGR